MHSSDPLYGWRWVVWFTLGGIAGLLIVLRLVI